ncbi:MAG: SAM-dependent methyltransferase [Bacteroidales bacterium]|nr:SAM-dependent methyltransferase [Bacteroidales bacterium]MCI2121801.1 SAM-dependent methyltransferase [Bacteroidales bacterium]MCI2144673.1 SAM-dependent methyltransferase [Bacteroidales bacterium]
MKGKLYMIPTPIGDNSPFEMLPKSTLDILSRIGVFVAEDVRTARRFLSSAGMKGRIDGLKIFELSEHSTRKDAEAYMRYLLDGEDMAVVSEAGLPAVADPGAMLVALAHEAGVEVVPLVGPSSLMLALMASGLNGQHFTFNGYLPVKSDERRVAILRLEKHSAAGDIAELFIETPYRNDALLSDILAVCKPDTELCIAADMTMPDSFIRTMTVARWKDSHTVIGKVPCVFLLQGAHMPERRGR